MATAITKVTCSPTSLSLRIDERGAVAASVTPANATTPITWTITSSLTQVCTVKGSSTSNKINITVTPVGAGTSKITVTAKNSASTVKTTFTVTVVDPIPAAETTVTYNGEVISVAAEEVPVSVMYNGSEIAALDSGDTVTLKTAGTKCNSDVTIGSVTLKCSGKYMKDDVLITVI